MVDYLDRASNYHQRGSAALEHIEAIGRSTHKTYAVEGGPAQVRETGQMERLEQGDRRVGRDSAAAELSAAGLRQGASGIVGRRSLTRPGKRNLLIPVRRRLSPEAAKDRNILSPGLNFQKLMLKPCTTLFCRGCSTYGHVPLKNRDSKKRLTGVAILEYPIPPRTHRD